MGTFLSPILGIPKILQGIPDKNHACIWTDDLAIRK
jgi:hypothetical protein